MSAVRIQTVNIREEMEQAYLDYAMSVIVARALPDVRDGLKPVHRRILYAMHDMGLFPERPHRKSARIVGEVLGKYHPHGEAAVYDAMARMAQDFSMRYPLVDGQGNFGCFTGDTKIRLLDGTERSFEELAELPPDEVFYVYSVDKSGRIVVGEGRNARVTRRNAQLIELTLDNGETIRCTPDHQFMLRDGTYKEAQHLTEGDSLMPGYFDTAPVGEGLNEYLRVFQPSTNEYKFVHHLADEFNKRKGQAPWFGGPFVRHHKNSDRWDNRPTNIERMGFLEHLRLHAERIRELWEDERFREAQRRGVQRYYRENPEVLEERRRRFIEQNKSEVFRRAQGRRVSKVLKRYYRENPEARTEISRRMKALWRDPDYRARMREALANVEKRELTPEEKQRVAQIISEKSRAMWADEDKRAEIIEAISRALASEEVRAKLSEAARRNWQDPEYRAKYPDDHFSRMAYALWADPATRERHREKIARQWEGEAFREAQRGGVQRSNARRLCQNPMLMKNLAASAAAALAEKWADPDYKRRVMRKRIAGYVARLLRKMGRAAVTPDVYQARRDANWIPNLEKALAYFEDFNELLDEAERYNHRVVAIRWLDERADVYDITVDEHHNFLLACGVFVHNSIDGDSPAAMRYTEARMSPLAQELLVDIDQDTVDFVDNFDGTLQEPTVLPARLPNLLLTGASGIAVGMSTNIPPHNLGEICDGLCYLIDHYEARDEVSVEELMEFVQGPDFPTGGLIYRYGQHDGEQVDTILRAYATGRGRIVMQARTHAEEMSRGRSRIVVTELPYQVNKSRLMERIAELARQERITGLSDLRDESGRQGLRVVIELSRGADPREVLEELFKQTQMRETFGVIMLALVDGEPRLLPLKRCLLEYIAHRQEVITRRSRHELEQARHRAHILEGLRMALDHLDEVIDTIRRSQEPRTARNNLQRKFKLSEPQAEAVLSMPLRRLARMEQARVEEEYKEVTSRISYLEDLLASPHKIMGVIKEELQELKARYGDERRTQIVEREERGVTQADFVPQERQMVVLTVDTVQRVPAQEFSFQRATGITTRAVKGHRVHLEVDPHDTLLLLTHRGRAFKCRAFQLPEKEKAVSQFLRLNQGEEVVTLLALPPEEAVEKAFLVLATAQGQVKRTCVADLSLLERAPGEVMGLEEGDALCFGGVSDGAREVLLVSSQGQAIRFAEEEVRPQVSPSARGVVGIRLGKGDGVVGAAVVNPQDQGELAVVSAKGYLKRTPLSDYPSQGRGGRGVRTANLNQRTGHLVAAVVLQPGQKLTILSQQGRRAHFALEDVPQMGRSTQGHRLANFGHQDTPARVVVL